MRTNIKKRNFIMLISLLTILVIALTFGLPKYKVVRAENTKEPNGSFVGLFQIVILIIMKKPC